MKQSLLMLGSGTSQGVPAIGCDCETCTSDDIRDKRLRPSVLFMVNGLSLLVDTSSDFRQQMLRFAIRHIDAVLYTHHHFDHIGGFDDLRQYNFLQKSPIRMYGLADTLHEIETTFRYAFGESLQQGGGLPSTEEYPLYNNDPFEIDGVLVHPLPVMHGKMPVLGYRIGGIAYITDTNYIPERTLERLHDLDVLVLDALRHREHPTHFCLEQAIETARSIGARRTCFTHIAHNIMHERDSVLLPDNMDFSYDGLVITSPQEHT